MGQQQRHTTILLPLPLSFRSWGGSIPPLLIGFAQKGMKSRAGAGMMAGMPLTSRTESRVERTQHHYIM